MDWSIRAVPENQILHPKRLGYAGARIPGKSFFLPLAGSSPRLCSAARPY